MEANTAQSRSRFDEARLLRPGKQAGSLFNTLESFLDMSSHFINKMLVHYILHT